MVIHSIMGLYGTANIMGILAIQYGYPLKPCPQRLPFQLSVSNLFMTIGWVIMVQKVRAPRSLASICFVLRWSNLGQLRSPFQYLVSISKYYSNVFNHLDHLGFPNYNPWTPHPVGQRTRLEDCSPAGTSTSTTTGKQ